MAFLLEIKEENTELDRLLAESRAAASELAACKTNWTQLMNLLQTLRDNVSMSFALEERYGYFENPAFFTPDLGASAALLRDEHWVLYTDLNAVIDNVEQRVYHEAFDVTPQRIARQLIAFCDNLLHHDAQEYALVLAIQESNSLAPSSSPDPGEEARVLGVSR